MKKYLIVFICVIVAVVVTVFSFLNLNYSREISSENNGLIFDLTSGQIISAAELKIEGYFTNYLNRKFEGSLSFAVNNGELSYLNSNVPIRASVIPVKMKGAYKTLIYHNMGTYRPFGVWFSTNKFDKLAVSINGGDGNSTNCFFVYPASTKDDALKILRELFNKTDYENVYALDM